MSDEVYQKVTAMHDIFNAGNVNIMIDEFGKRVWVCTDDRGTILRLARIKNLTIEDLRLTWNHNDSAESETE